MIFFSFHRRFLFCLIIEIEDWNKKEEEELYSEWSSLFCLLYVIIIYIHLWSHFYRCWVEEAERERERYLIYIYQCRQAKKKILKREKDHENTFSFVLLPFLSDFLILLFSLSLNIYFLLCYDRIEKEKKKAKKKGRTDGFLSL